jgi:hypothetical protein
MQAYEQASVSKASAQSREKKEKTINGEATEHIGHAIIGLCMMDTIYDSCAYIYKFQILESRETTKSPRNWQLLRNDSGLLLSYNYPMGI